MADMEMLHEMHEMHAEQRKENKRDRQWREEMRELRTCVRNIADLAEPDGSIKLLAEMALDKIDDMRRRSHDSHT